MNAYDYYHGTWNYSHLPAACPMCHYNVAPKWSERTQGAAYILFFFLLIFFFPLCWLPFVMMKERYVYCPHCKGEYR